MKNRVVITGMGVVSCLGSSLDDLWTSMMAGQSGIVPLDMPGSENLRVQIAGLVKGYTATDYFSKKDLRKIDPSIQYGVVAAQQAVAQSKILDYDALDANRVGVSVGSGIGGLQYIEDTAKVLFEQGPRRVSANFVPSTIINMISGHISIRFGFKGPNLATVTACAAGTHNIGLGARLIACGDADAMLVGGAEHASTMLAMAGFGNMKALSGNNANPEQASRPFDKDRDGFVLSNGSAVLMLESLSHAKARGATILAELTGVGMSGDAHHATQPDQSGDGARRVMQSAIQDANLQSSDIDYVNAHGTSTYFNDLVETKAIGDVFGAGGSVAVSSTKSMMGHMLGAAGAIEGVIAVMTLQNQTIPATINCDNPDVGLDLNLIRHQPAHQNVNHVMSNSFGFGGTNGCLIFSRYAG